MAGVAGEKFRDDAEAIKIRCKAGANDGGLFSTIERRGTGEEPSGEEMSDRAHWSLEREYGKTFAPKRLTTDDTDQTDFH